MINIYYFLFKFLLIMPIFGIINSIFVNKYFKLQKIINNIIYSSLSILSFCIIILYTIYGKYDFTFFEISKNMPIVFSANSFNLTFCFIITITIFLFNMVFQNYFNYLNLFEKYKLFNKEISYIYWFCILLFFSTNIMLSVFLYMLILIFSFFLIKNPELQELRKKYSVVFSVSMISCICLFCIIGFYFLYNGNILFISQNLSKINNISLYWLLTIFFFLICINFLAPIYVLFYESLFYEDLLPIFIISLLPFTILNTFLFIKIIRYIFINNVSNIGLYFYYAGFGVVVLFLIACFFCIKYITNNIKFILLFLILNFLVFLTQILFISVPLDILKIFTNFLFFSMSSILVVLVYSSILFLLLKLDITEIKKLNKKYKMELIFYMVCLIFPLFVNINSFLDLNFHNFNLLYLINLIEICIIFIIYITYLIISLYKKLENENVELSTIDSKIKINYFFPQILFFVIFAFLFLLKSQIFKFIVFYK